MKRLLALALFSGVMFGQMNMTINNSVTHGGGPWPNGYTWRRTGVPLCATGSAQTNFKALISGTYTDMKTTGNGGTVTDSNGYDIIVTSDSAGSTLLDFQRDFPSDWASTGKINLWVRIPTLDNSSCTTVYVFYANSMVTTDQSNPDGVWGSCGSFKLVSHLRDGATLTATDSSGCGNNGTLGSGAQEPTPTTGKIDGGANFLASNAQYIHRPTFTGISAIEGPLTMSAWVKYSADAGSVLTLVKDDSGSAGNAVELVWDGSGVLNVDKWGSTHLVSSSTLSSGTWHFVAYTVDGSNNNKLYADGAAAITSTTTTDTGAAGVSWTGSFNLSFPDYLNADVDELHVVAAVLSANWLATEYANQTTPIALGSAQ